MHTPRFPAALVLALAVLLAPAPAPAHSLELSGGFLSAFDGDVRTVFGTAPAVALAWAAPVSDNAQVFLEAGYETASGDELVSPDPTFQFEESSFHVVPIVLGVRVHAVPAENRKSVDLLLGAGLVNYLTRYSDPNGEDHDAPGFGAMVEIRPEIRLGDTWSAFVRQRIQVALDVDYGDGGEFNYSGAHLTGGVSYRIR